MTKAIVNFILLNNELVSSAAQMLLQKQELALTHTEIYIHFYKTGKIPSIYIEMIYLN